MKRSIVLLSALVTIFSVLSSYAGVGQSAVITLVFPYGARSYGMGEVGTALADDGSVLFFNPAGLALPNSDWEDGSCSYFYEPLLPAFIDSLWHTSFSANYQDTSFFLGQFGFFRNYINMGENIFTDELGREVGKSRSWESVTALGWGFDFKNFGIRNHYFGMTFKFFTSALAPGVTGPGTGVARSVAVDAGYLWTIGHGFRLGATLMNMGPPVYYIDPEKADPIPFTINLAAAYKRSFGFDGIQWLSLAAEVRFDREVVKNYPDTLHTLPDPFYRAIWTDLLYDTSETPKFEWEQVNRHYGGELTFLNTFSIREGYLIDIAGERYEYHHGFGIRLFNHIAIDWANIFSPAGYMRAFARRYGPQKMGASGARDGQWQVSFTATRLFNWSEGDLAWWETKRN